MVHALPAAVAVIGAFLIVDSVDPVGDTSQLAVGIAAALLALAALAATTWRRP